MRLETTVTCSSNSTSSCCLIWCTVYHITILSNQIHEFKCEEISDNLELELLHMGRFLFIIFFLAYVLHP
jgi:hypothetical protein